MIDRCECLRAVVLDWAGTTIDHGSRAPTQVFLELFRRRGVPITVDQARQPMGMAKREHIAAIAAMPPVASAWEDRHGKPAAESDVDAMYGDFLPMQKETLREHCLLIPGVAMAVDQCRKLGLKIGSTTGYTRELMAIVAPIAAEQGYEPDCVLCAEDAPAGRPHPDLLREAARRLEIDSMESIVKVDDTVVGVQAGRNAGCWTIGVTRTGNGVGLSESELDELPEEQVRGMCDAAGATLMRAGAHYTIESVTMLPAILRVIELRIQQGDRPE